MASTSDEAEATPATRSERRRAGTRARIVVEAERLMRRYGVEAVTVQDITDAADVGHGTFYLHFKTKAEVLRPVIERLAEKIHERVDRLTSGSDDPALRLATGIRIALAAIAGDPLWNWYVFQSGTPFRRLADGMGAPPLEDMDRGIALGRFLVSDLRATWSFIDGALIGILSTGKWQETTAEAAAEMVLRSLGISPDEAALIARRPLVES